MEFMVQKTDIKTGRTIQSVIKVSTEEYNKLLKQAIEEDTNINELIERYYAT